MLKEKKRLFPPFPPTAGTRKLYYFTLTLSFLCITILTVIIMRKSREEIELVLKGEMDRKVLALVASYYEGDMDQFTETNSEIRAIVIYEKGGALLYSYRNEPHIDRNGRSEDKTYQMFLSYELDRLASRIPAEARFHREMWWDSSRRNIIIDLEAEVDGYFEKTRSLRAIQIIIHAFTSLLFLQLLLLFFRSNRLQNQLDSQQNLVILGSALRTLTHEMKNPLAAIRLHSGFIRKLYPEELREETSVIDSEVHRLSRLMEDVKNYLREPKGAPEPIDLNTFLSDLRRLYPENISWRIPERSGCVFFDRERLRSVMENLIDNALESGSDPADIRIELRRDRRFHLIRVSDRGRGIPAAAMGLVFDPLYTTKHNGTGTGLMIVKRFIHAGGGDISINSVEGKGSQAALKIPIRSEEKKL